MMEAFKQFVLREPARFYLIVRAVFYVLAGYFAWAQDVDLEPLLSLLALLLGIDITSTERGVRANVYQPETVAQLVKESAFLPGLGSVWITEVGKFVLSLIRGKVSRVQVPEAMQLLGPLVAELARSQLTPQVRADLQATVHRQLEKANLIKKTTIPPRVLSLLLVVLLLPGCAVLEELVSGGAQELTADGSSLGYTDMGVLFDPGGAPALLVVATVRGEALVFYDDTDTCQRIEDHWRCYRSEVVEPWLIDLSGEDVSAVVTFARASGSQHLVLP